MAWRLLLALLALGLLAGAVLRGDTPPLMTGDPVALFGADALARAQAYQGARRILGVAALLLAAAVPILLASTSAGRALVSRATAGLSGRPVRAAVLAALIVVLLTDLVLLPLAAWSGLVHDARFGFRTLSVGAWLGRWALVRLPGWIAVGIGAAVVTWLVRRLPALWEPVLAVGAALTAVALVLAGPLLLEPLATRTHPLPPGPVREAVTPVLERAGLGGTTLAVADASRRTTKENAYVSGLGPTRHVVLYDTLLAGRTPPEVAAVVAHELGHDLHHDIERLAALGAAGGILGVLLLGVTLRRGARRHEDGNGPAIGPHDIVRGIAVLAIAGLLVTPLTLAASRRAEAAADAEAVALTGDPGTVVALVHGLAEANLSDLDPPRWAVVLLGSHPTPPDRIATVRALGRGQP